MFEGTAPQFWSSLCRIKALPPSTMLYCAHEYTQSNARFALHADPDNAKLADYVRHIEEARAAGKPTVPTTLSRELATNPFLRADDPAMQARWANHGGKIGDAVETFAALRAAKDTF
jgi:hydroxyacylglutathione hydrolase